MRKLDIINAVSTKTGMHKVDVITCLDAILNEIKESLAEDKNVYLRGFGSFVIKTRKSKIGRNIRLQTSVIIPEKKIISLKASPELLESINKVAKKELEESADAVVGKFEEAY